MSGSELFFLVLSLVAFVYFVAYCLFTFGLIGLSLFEAALQRLQRGDRFVAPTRPLRPGISLVVPAYNEEQVVVPATRALLGSDYDPLEVVVVDDGSSDRTVEVLDEAFELVELPVGDRLQLPTEPVEQLFVSRADPRLRVARKRNGGRSDALNAGINVARQPLVALVDADSLLDRDALARIVEVFSADPDRILAVGGAIRIANGGTIENGVMIRPRVPLHGTEASQVCEYLRAFSGTRIAWARLNGLLIISGAFGVFRRDVLRSVGGISRETMGEDMELVMRLHAQLRPRRPELRIEFAADATSWTEAPPALGPLRGQRVRWHIGLLDNLRLHLGMTARRRYGAVGLLALPYTLAYEVIGPVVQLLGFIGVVGLIVTDRTSWEYAAAFVVILLLTGQLQTTGALLVEEVVFGRYRRRDLLVLGLWSLLEIFWYRPLTVLWRLRASVLWLTGRRPGWGTIPRGAALAGPTGAEAAPAPLVR